MPRASALWLARHSWGWRTSRTMRAWSGSRGCWRSHTVHCGRWASALPAVRHASIPPAHHPLGRSSPIRRSCQHASHHSPGSSNTSRMAASAGRTVPVVNDGPRPTLRTPGMWTAKASPWRPWCTDGFSPAMTLAALMTNAPLCSCCPRCPYTYCISRRNFFSGT